MCFKCLRGLDIGSALPIIEFECLVGIDIRESSTQRVASLGFIQIAESTPRAHQQSAHCRVQSRSTLAHRVQRVVARAQESVVIAGRPRHTGSSPAFAKSSYDGRTRRSRWRCFARKSANTLARAIIRSRKKRSLSSQVTCIAPLHFRPTQGRFAEHARLADHDRALAVAQSIAGSLSAHAPRRLAPIRTAP